MTKQPSLSLIQNDIIDILVSAGCTSPQQLMCSADITARLISNGYIPNQVQGRLLDYEIDDLIAQGLVGEVPHNRLSRYIYKIKRKKHMTKQPSLSPIQNDIIDILVSAGCTSPQQLMCSADITARLISNGYIPNQVQGRLLDYEIDDLIAQGLVGEVPHNRLSRYIYKI